MKKAMRAITVAVGVLLFLLCAMSLRWMVDRTQTLSELEDQVEVNVAEIARLRLRLYVLELECHCDVDGLIAQLGNSVPPPP